MLTLPNILANTLPEMTFPSLCSLCMEEDTSDGNQFCLKCTIEMPYTTHYEKKENQAAIKFWGRFPCQEALSMLNLFNFSNVRNLIHQFKYEGKREIAYNLGKMMGHKAMKHQKFQSVDSIIPIPLHPKKQARRGYNQSMEIAKGLSEIINKPIADDILFKITNTESQTKKSRIDRVFNVLDSFKIFDKQAIEGKHFLIVDDVLTTGATVEAAATRLLESRGVTLSVYTTCIARS